MRHALPRWLLVDPWDCIVLAGYLTKDHAGFCNVPLGHRLWDVHWEKKWSQKWFHPRAILENGTTLEGGAVFSLNSSTFVGGTKIVPGVELSTMLRTMKRLQWCSRFGPTFFSVCKLGPKSEPIPEEHFLSNFYSFHYVSFGPSSYSLQRKVPDKWNLVQYRVRLNECNFQLSHLVLKLPTIRKPRPFEWESFFLLMERQIRWGILPLYLWRTFNILDDTTTCKNIVLAEEYQVLDFRFFRIVQLKRGLG